MKRFVAIACAILLTACAHYPVNAPLARADFETGYRYGNMDLPREDDTFIVLTFSGGGSRAAGFAYGVLRELEKVELPDGTRLIDRVDVISSVSGGSFTSMYYGLHGREGLASFKERFLDRNIEGMLVRAALNPVNVVRLLSPNFSRIDLAAELYDRVLFDGRTYADLHAEQTANRRPFIVANATELDLGARFEWTQDQFDPICSDLSKTHVARAVAASSAFPVLLTPMVLRNYHGEVDCGFVRPHWVENALGDIETNASRHRNAVELEAYLNPRRDWLHLMDGGLADNIGLRGTLHALTSTDTWQMDDPTRRQTGYTLRGPLNRREIKRVLVIVVNAATGSDLHFDLRKTNPRLPAILSAISFTPMNNFSFDTVQMLNSIASDYTVRQSLPRDCQKLASETCPDVKIPGAAVPPVSFYPVVLGFSAIVDDELRHELNAIGTNFALKKGQLQLLERAARELLASSEAYQEYLHDAGAKIVD